MNEWFDSYWAVYSTVIFSIGVNALLALSIYLTLSCGLLSLANAAFMGIGAYAAALLTMNYDLAFPLALACGTLVPMLVALVIGLPTLRLSGVYLAMATLGFGEVVRVIVLNVEFTGGPLGLNGIPPKTEFWHIAILLALVLFGLARLRRSKIGRAFDAIRADEIAAQLMGVHVARYKLLAFVLGAGIAGLAGALNAHYTFTIGPANYGFENAVELLTMTVFGGTSALAGPVLGATVMTILPEALRGLRDYRLAFNGLILILVVLFMPDGLYDRKRFRRLLQGVKSALKRTPDRGGQSC